MRQGWEGPRRRGGIGRARAWACALALAAATSSACSAGTDMVGAQPKAPTVGFGSTAPATGSGGSGTDQSCGPTVARYAPDASAINSRAVQKIKKNGVLTVGVSADQYLTGYLASNGQEEGFDIDLAHALAASLFGDPNKVQFDALSTANRIPDLKSGTVDLVIDTMTITCARLDQIDFSAVYFEASQKLLVTSKSTVTSLAQLAGQKVCAQAGSTSIGQIQKARATAVQVTNVSDCLVLLQENQVAAISTDDTLLAGLAQQDPNLKVVGQGLEPEPYGIGMAKPGPRQPDDLEAWVNSVLAQYEADGRWEKSYQKWFGKSLPAAQPPALQYSH